jgi:hypothetical protein
MEMVLGEIDAARLSITTNEPQQTEVISVRLNASLATPGPDFEVTFVDAGGNLRTATFPPGSDTTRTIPQGQRGLFELAQVVRPGDGATVTVLVKPEYTFRRLP